MIFHQFEAKGLSHYSYLLADKEEGLAIVIDPERDVKTYIEFAAEHRLRIAYITETHIHADYASGTRELARRCGAEVCLSGYDQGEKYTYSFPHRDLMEGDTLTVGKITLKVLHTPGHTPEHISFLMFENGSTTPSAIFSGDFLFIGSVGRPDLLGEGDKMPLARKMYHSVNRHLPALPEALRVYPGHGAGSLCGAGLGKGSSSTIGEERSYNPYLQPQSEQEFTDRLLGVTPPFPQYYLRMKQMNADGPPILEGTPKPQPVSVADFAELANAGAKILDVRHPLAFGGGHVIGSLNIGMPDHIGFWGAWTLPYEEDFYIVTDDPGKIRSVWQSLIRVGLDRAKGYLAPSMDSFVNAGNEFTDLPNVSAHVLNDLTELNEPITILDVRARQEFEDGHIKGAKHIYLGELPERLGELKDKEAAIFCVCAGGMRSSIAGSILLANGYEDVYSVFGGVTAWKAAGFPLTTSKSKKDLLPQSA